MNQTQNRIVLGDAVLRRLGAGPESAREVLETFEERHASLKGSEDPPSSLLDAWDAALRRLIDRVRAELPAKVAELLAPASAAPKTTESSKSTRAKAKPRPNKRPRDEGKKKKAPRASKAQTSPRKVTKRPTSRAPTLR